MIGFRNFLDVDKDFPVGFLREIRLQFFNFGTLASDDDARA